jgi:hypothetical protein
VRTPRVLFVLTLSGVVLGLVLGLVLAVAQR